VCLQEVIPPARHPPDSPGPLSLGVIPPAMAASFVTVASEGPAAERTARRP
jgi:hypothetical protein